MIPVPFLTGKSVAVMGLGKSGTATVRALTASGVDVLAWDDNEQARAAGLAAGLPIRDPAPLLDGLEAVLWSPGVPHTHPKPHPLATAARALGKPVVCDIDLLARARAEAAFLGVTGTNGKSTTTTLLAHVLKTAGRPMDVGGNLGMPALDLAPLGRDGTYVLELSSYQLELIPSLAFAASVLLNITPDHLARHGGMDGYIAAKRRVFTHTRTGGTAVIGVDDEPCRKMRDELLAEGRLRVVPISVQGAAAGGVYAPDGRLIDDTAGQARSVIDLTAIATLPGRHNWQNACAVFAMARAHGIDEADILRALRSYPGLAHRQQSVGVIDGIAYVNDSKATNADAAEKALVCYDHIYWIAGGQPKEGGIVSLEPHFPRIRHAFLIGDAAQDFARTIEGKVAYTQCGDLATAVARAQAMASAEAIPGAVVLLSPACASWDQFKSFEHRGDVFRDLVAKIAGDRA